MPVINADINGYVTPIHIDYEQLPTLSPIVVTDATGGGSGDANSYTIDYGSGLVEKGGVVTFTTDTSSGQYREGYARVDLPFTILDAQVSAWNVVAGPSDARRESAFLRLDGNTLVIYGWFMGSEHREMKVKWMAKGLKR